MPLEISQSGASVSFSVRVQPRASHDEISGEYAGALKVRLAAPPVEGRANEALMRFLATSLNVPTSAVKIASGVHSRTKRVEIRGVTPEQIRALVSAARR